MGPGVILICSTVIPPYKSPIKYPWLRVSQKKSISEGGKARNSLSKPVYPYVHLSTGHLHLSRPRTELFIPVPCPATPPQSSLPP